MGLVPWVCARCPSPDVTMGAALPGAHGLPRLSQQVRLEEFGRPKIDGELKVRSIVNHTKQDRWAARRPRAGGGRPAWPGTPLPAGLGAAFPEERAARPPGFV